MGKAPAPAHLPRARARERAVVRPDYRQDFLSSSPCSAGKPAVASRPLSRVLILAGDSDGNLGDRAILMALCKELTDANPGVAVTVVSRDRERASHDFQAAVLSPGLSGLPRLCAAAARSDLVVCGGGGLFQDDDSLIKMPYWGVRVALMRLLNRRVVGYSLGVGPLKAASSRLFARLAFACMERVSVRDPRAYQSAQPLTGEEVQMVPDPAILLQAAPDQAALSLLHEHHVPLDGRPLIGVAPRRWFPPRARLIPNRLTARWRRPAPPCPLHAQLTAQLAEVLDRLVARHGAHIVFLPTYNLDHEGDEKVCREIQDQMSAPGGSVIPMDDPRLYKAVARRLSVLLGGRMHPTILAASAGTPVVGLAYNPKFHGFFELLGQQERLLNVTDFVHGGQVDELTTMVETAMAAGGPAPAIVQRLGNATRQFTHQIAGAGA